MSDFFIAADSGHIKRERAKARELRKSQWWKRKMNEGICYYCEQKFVAKELTMDHKVPLARGGFSIKTNIVVACKTCNNDKKHTLAIDWMPNSQANPDEESS